jgi:hypothetical protein
MAFPFFFYPQMNADAPVCLPRSGVQLETYGRSRLRRSATATSASICVICG